MKIGIDFSPTEDSPAGIGQYTINLISKLIEIDKDNEYFIYSYSPKLINNAQNIPIKLSGRLPGKGIRWMRKVIKDAKSKNIDVLISTSNHYFVKLFPKTIQFIHDLAPIKHPNFFKKKFSLQYQFSTKNVLKNAYKIVTISKTVRNDLLKLDNTHTLDIATIYPAPSRWLNLEPKNESDVLIKYQLPREYLFSLSTLEPRKNYVNQIKAFKIFKEETDNEIKMIVIGKKGWFYDKIFQTVKELGLEGEIRFLGYVPNEEISPIYKNSQAFINLSFYEGFGMPAMEALYFNVPTLLSDIPVYRECFDKYAKFCDPNDPKQIADMMSKVLEQKKVDSHSEIIKNYSWEKSANKLLTLINE